VRPRATRAVALNRTAPRPVDINYSTKSDLWAQARVSSSLTVGTAPLLRDISSLHHGVQILCVLLERILKWVEQLSPRIPVCGYS